MSGLWATQYDVLFSIIIIFSTCGVATLSFFWSSLFIGKCRSRAIHTYLGGQLGNSDFECCCCLFLKLGCVDGGGCLRIVPYITCPKGVVSSAASNNWRATQV